MHEEERHRLYGANTGNTYELGEHVEMILAEATPVTGGLLFHLLDAGVKKTRKPAPKKTRSPAKRKRK